MIERRKEIYISVDVLHSLILLAQAQNADVDLQRRVSSDELADNILRDHIKERYPQLLEYRKTLERMEKEIVENLSKNRIGN